MARGHDQTFVVPMTVLSEVDYFVTKDLGPIVAADFMERYCNGELQVDHLVRADFPLIVELMRQYADNGIGFVDASVVAVAEA